MPPRPKLYSPAVNAGLAPRIGSGAVVRMPRLARIVLSQRTLKSLPPKSVSMAAAGRATAKMAAIAASVGSSFGNVGRLRFKGSPASEKGK